MRQFYESWCSQLKSLTTVSEIGNCKPLTAVSEIDAFQLVENKGVEGEVFDLSIFLSLGFTHHMIIVRKVKMLAERLFYICLLYTSYILAINGKSLKEVDNLFSELIDMAGKTVELTVNTTPVEKGARNVLVVPLADESKLYYYHWVQNNIRKVNEATNGEDVYKRQGLYHDAHGNFRANTYRERFDQCSPVLERR